MRPQAANAATIKDSRPGSRRRKVATLTVGERAQAMERLKLLRQLSFGAQVAEDEVNELARYFVHTDQWNRIFKGDVDIVRGEKGAGKSAIYLLLNAMSNDLFDRGVVMVSGEKPRGTTVFKDLMSDPPTTEAEFIVLWKLYILTIISHEIRSLGMASPGLQKVYGALEEVKLLERELNLSGLLRQVQTMARRLLNPKLEVGAELDQQTGGISGIIGRISLAEPATELRSKGISSLDGWLEVVNRELKGQGYQVWVLLDRLDVAFADNNDLESNALRALMKVYGDFRDLDYIHLKIFIREDIWNRILGSGFREASHITRYEVMNWNYATLLNLLMRRMLNNDVLVAEYGIDREAVLADNDEQEKLLKRVFPLKVEQGNNPETFKWMVNRCADAKDRTTPRELIHLLNCVREEEIKRLELGGKPPEADQLFDRGVFKPSLARVSKARVETWLYSEYANQKAFVEKLIGQKAEQTPESLAELWGMTRSEAITKAGELVNLGFFQQRGEQSSPTFWVPFLYREALDLVQGRETGAGRT